MPTFSEKLLLSPADLSHHFGLSKTAIYALIKMDGFPQIKINGKHYIPTQSFEKWLEKNVGQSLTFRY